MGDVRSWALVAAVVTLAACGARSRGGQSGSECGVPLGSLRSQVSVPTGGIGRDAWGARVVSVDIEGLNRVPRDLAVAAIESRAGQRLEGATLRGDLRRLWALEAFADARVDAAPAEGGIALTFAVVERPLVGSVVTRIDGGSRDPASSVNSEWRRARALAGGVFDPLRVHRVATELRSRYASAGYLAADIDIRGRTAGGRVDLCFIAAAGPRFSIDRMELDGNRRLEVAVLRKLIDTRDRTVNIEGGVYRAGLLERDIARIQALYHDRGMVQATVGPARIEIDRERARVRIRLPIHEGDVYRLGALRVSGDLAIAASDHAAALGLRTGDVFSRTQVAEAMVRLQEREAAAGRPDAVVVPLTNLDLARRTIDLEFEVARGEPPARQDEDAP